MKALTRTVATVNNVSILIVENGEKIVPIRPICKAMGIDEDSQKRKIEGDEILSSVATLSMATGADGKNYEMFCIPYEFIFGWLFTINPKNVKPEAQAAVTEYKLACYKALFRSFTAKALFLEHKEAAMKAQIEVVNKVSRDFREAQSTLKLAKARLNTLKDTTLEEWEANNRQLSFEFPEETEE
ncbi:chromosome partitioning protein ParA [Rufibacter immobilis]|uniref:Chromosome partitioning protein ParA n=1 Tax=Rufibacter immobilis TaxID=1348778 RepID=A0A3M9MQ73_9BACT|nr:phage antirepressor N-terminal domain-containing protein [Rufibacter immobilis]RNI27659.1 chromosome partitioning protein ParA [Rufibacter immobilis]